MRNSRYFQCVSRWLRAGLKRAAFSSVMFSAALGLAVPANAADPINIGATASITGKYAESGKYYEQAYRLWEAQTNAAGGLLGRPVEVTIYDDKSDPDTGLSLYEQLITVDRVDLILGPYTSAVINPVSALAEKYGKLFLQGGGNSAALFERGFKYMFLTLPGLAHDFPAAMVDYLAEKPDSEQPKTAAILFLDNQAMVAEVAGLKAELEGIGIKVVYEEKIPENIADLSSTMAQVQNSGADVVFGHLFLPQGVMAVRAAKQVGYAPKAFWLSVGPALGEWGTTLGADGNFIWGSTMFSPAANTPGLDKFVSAFEGKYGKLPGYHAAAAYAAAQILADAITATNSLDDDTLRDYVAGHSFSTVIGELSWDDAGRPKPSILLVQWQDGKQQIIRPAAAATAEPVYPAPSWSER
ncbi:MAG: amino acid ABC transporter substrate-binding protein [Pseudaminobacter sp.]